MADLNQMIANSLFRASPSLRGEDVTKQIEDLIRNSGKSQAWQNDQIKMNKEAAAAGIPAFVPTQQDSAARLRLKDAIARSHASGFKFPYFIGKQDEPLGDRGVTMDIENLVSALKAQELSAIAAGNKAALDKIAKERAFWEKEASEGMSASEWKAATGYNDPSRFLKSDRSIINLR